MLQVSKNRLANFVKIDRFIGKHISNWLNYNVINGMHSVINGMHTESIHKCHKCYANYVKFFSWINLIYEMGNINENKVRQQNRTEHTITHYPVARTFSNMEIIRPSSQVRHVEWHVELHLQILSPQDKERKKRQTEKWLWLNQAK